MKMKVIVNRKRKGDLNGLSFWSLMRVTMTWREQDTQWWL